MELQVGVKVLLKNSKGKYLLIRRSPKKYPKAGPKWDIVGGRITPGTTLLENLKREVKEETGLDLDGQLKLVGAQDILGIKGYPNRHVVRLTYLGQTEGTPKISDESLEFGWFTRKEITKMDAGKLDKYFKELLNAGLIPSS